MTRISGARANIFWLFHCSDLILFLQLIDVTNNNKESRSDYGFGNVSK